MIGTDPYTPDLVLTHPHLVLTHARATLPRTDALPPRTSYLPPLHTMIRSATYHHHSGATWHFTVHTVAGQPPPDHRSTVVNDGSQRWSTAVNIAGPPPDHRRTTGQRWRNTAGPPLDCRRTTGQRWRSTTVNGGGPPLTTAGPPVNGG
ncbi:hypothetical protein Tco_1099135 [Tanacetum coccineum]